jgi:ABC-type transport system substrate-binding protein
MATVRPIRCSRRSPVAYDPTLEGRTNYDVDKAKALLSSVGVSDLKFDSIIGSTSAPTLPSVRFLQAKPEEAGINMNLELVDVDRHQTAGFTAPSAPSRQAVRRDTIIRLQLLRTTAH